MLLVFFISLLDNQSMTDKKLSIWSAEKQSCVTAETLSDRVP
jgi:hypothetical protein